jgi:HTH-type transcriptional repressor of NAD biosynthesis genes
VTRGLVLGKFAPLHAGHQLLIETALARVDELVILVYPAPEVTWIPLARRAEWIRALYPRARVVEGHDGPTSAGRAASAMREQEEYILRTVPQPVTHFFSSEWYGEHVSRALGAEDVRVDPERRRVPVSGTLVRADPFAHRGLLAPVVYRDLVRKVAFLGAESTGKTTLTALVAAEHGTRGLLEPGRSFWDRHRDGGERLTLEQLVRLAHEHLEQEDAAVLEARGVLFVDTNALTTEAYAYRHHGRTDPELARLARQAETRYDVTFVCGDEIPFVQDGTRLDEEARSEMQRRLCGELDRRGVLWTRVEGPLALRTLRVGKVLASLWPHGPSDHFTLA